MAFIYKMVETENGNLVATSDKGFPIIIDEDKNEEIPLDAIHLYMKVPSLQNEKKQLKEKLDEVTKKFELFEDVEDLEKFKTDASKALETLKNIEDKKLVDAGQVETIKKQAQDQLQRELETMKKGYEARINELSELNNSKTQQIYKLMVDDRFSTSEFVKNQLNIPAAVARKYFGENFKVEPDDNGANRVVGYFKGEKLLSKTTLGELADFDEALSIMVENDAAKDTLLKGDKGSGGGAHDSDTNLSKKSLAKRYEEAVKAGDTMTMISLKRQMFPKK